MPAAIGITVVFLMAGLLAVIFRNIRHGSSCCGEREGPEPRIRPADPNPAHYPYRYIAEIEGMVCGGCVRKVENAFHREEGLLVSADLSKKQMEVSAKHPLKREDVLAILRHTSYTLLDFKEVDKGETK